MQISPHKLTCKLELRLPTQSCAQQVGGQTLVSARVLVPAQAADRQVASVQPVVRTHGEIQVCAILPPPSRGKKSNYANHIKSQLLFVILNLCNSRDRFKNPTWFHVETVLLVPPKITVPMSSVKSISRIFKKSTLVRPGWLNG